MTERGWRRRLRAQARADARESSPTPRRPKGEGSSVRRTLLLEWAADTAIRPIGGKSVADVDPFAVLQLAAAAGLTDVSYEEALGALQDRLALRGHPPYAADPLWTATRR